MKKLSLRLRLIVFFTGISCLIWVIAGALSWHETKEKVDEFFDTYQMLLARQLAASDWNIISPETQQRTNKIIKNIKNADEEDEAIGFAVFNQDGRIIFHDNENGRYFHFDNQDEGRFVNLKIDDEDWRIVFIKSADEKFLIAVGQELEYRNDIALDMAEEFMLPWGGGLLLLLILIVFMISREFAPLRKLAFDLHFRKTEDLSPLPEDGIPQEILPLIRALNVQFVQIDELLKRERSFISDSAHELRSPLTALKVQLEVLRLSIDDEASRNNAMQKLEIGIERSARLVEQLLALSRLEASFEQENDRQQINWPQIISTLKEEYAPAAESKNIAFKLDVNGTPPFDNGNQTLAALMVRNLLDNAIKYSPREANIEIIIKNKELIVSNSGIDLDKDTLTRLGERFFRPAGQKETGSGLGLSIVLRIADFYGCKVSFDNKDGKFIVTIKQNN